MEYSDSGLKNRKLNKDKANKLCPCLDDQVVLRVEGPLTHASICEASVGFTQQAPSRDSPPSETRNDCEWSPIQWHIDPSPHINKCRKFRKCTGQQRMEIFPKEWMETTPEFTYGFTYGLIWIILCHGRKKRVKALTVSCVHEFPEQYTLKCLMNWPRMPSWKLWLRLVAIQGAEHQIRFDQGTNSVGARWEFVELW